MEGKGNSDQSFTQTDWEELEDDVCSWWWCVSGRDEEGDDQ